MLYFYEDEKMAKARIDAFIEETKELLQAQESREAKRVSRERTFRLPDLSGLFANWKSGKDTAVANQPC